MADKRKLSPESLRAHLLHNPIADMEYRVRAVVRPRAWQHATWLFLAFLCVLPLVGMGLHAREVALFPEVRRWRPPNHHTTTFVMLALLLFINYLLTTLKTLYTAADSFGRERRDRTLEMLLMTGVSARQLVLGKWAGVLRALTPDYIYLFVLRVLVIYWGYIRILFNTLGYSEANPVELLPTLMRQVPIEGVLLLSLLAGVSLALEAMMAAAIGMMWVTVRKKQHRDLGAVFTHLAVSLLPMLLMGLLLYGLPALVSILGQYRYNGLSLLPHPEAWLIFTSALADNSILSTGWLMNMAANPPAQPAVSSVVLSLLAGLLLYLPVTVAALRDAQQRVQKPARLQLPIPSAIRRKPRREPSSYEPEIV